MRRLTPIVAANRLTPARMAPAIVTVAWLERKRLSWLNRESEWARPQCLEQATLQRRL